ncbi:hypothetical protein JSE7799_00303 [Jannaschia seosinensis]|uniref:Uncharacterized protein n=1 Tax=Jannaschia seosinensis TaxID=313367 RepID=A0A0M7B6C4_9RHOB|nr:hypothetical protein [Jannaschia seosinensis]CUH15384.1 hypothetical protein JSE7799_00303 [Jannaschia seosinensis]
MRRPLWMVLALAFTAPALSACAPAAGAGAAIAADQVAEEETGEGLF